MWTVTWPAPEFAEEPYREDGTVGLLQSLFSTDDFFAETDLPPSEWNSEGTIRQRLTNLLLLRLPQVPDGLPPGYLLCSVMVVPSPHPMIRNYVETLLSEIFPRQVPRALPDQLASLRRRVVSLLQAFGTNAYPHVMDTIVSFRLAQARSLHLLIFLSLMAPKIDTLIAQRALEDKIYLPEDALRPGPLPLPSWRRLESASGQRKRKTAPDADEADVSPMQIEPAAPRPRPAPSPGTPQTPRAPSALQELRTFVCSFVSSPYTSS